MPRDPESLIDIANAIRRILRYTNGINEYPLESLQKCLVVADEIQTRIRRPAE